MKCGKWKFYHSFILKHELHEFILKSEWQLTAPLCIVQLDNDVLILVQVVSSKPGCCTIRHCAASEILGFGNHCSLDSSAGGSLFFPAFHFLLKIVTHCYVSCNNKLVCRFKFPSLQKCIHFHIESGCSMFLSTSPRHFQEKHYQNLEHQRQHQELTVIKEEKRKLSNELQALHCKDKKIRDWITKLEGILHKVMHIYAHSGHYMTSKW